MKKFLRILILTIAMVLCMGLFCVNAFADGTCGDNVTWSYNYPTLTISGTGAMTDFSSIDDVPWQDYRGYIYTVVIENGVTNIGACSFYKCTNLTNVSIPNSVTTIGNTAFSNCTSLTSISIPNSVTTIGQYAFYYCYNLKNVTIPNSVTALGDDAFNSCTYMKSVTISNSVTSIGSRAFCGCVCLTSVVIPNSVTSIGYYAFGGCSGLESITIPSSVISIGEKAFDGCTILENIYIDSLEQWMSYDHAASYLYLRLNSSGKLYIDGNELTVITIPDSVATIGDQTFYGCTSLTNVTIPNSVTTIGDNAFYRCSNLTNIIIPDSVTSIGNYSFSGCTSLNAVTFNGSAPTFGNRCFSDVTATAYYPCDDDTWTENVMQDYGGTLTWELTHDFEENICSRCGMETGTCGNDLTWCYVDGTLTISGTGAMDDYTMYSGSSSNAPW